MKTEISIYILFGILLIHWVGDFILQSDEQAKGKSKSNYFLTMHVLTYTSVWFFCCLAYSCIFYFQSIWSFTSQGTKFMFLFPAITFVCHWITDYFTSRLNTRLHTKGDIHNFFVSIGFDQILHYVQLIITFQLLTQ